MATREIITTIALDGEKEFKKELAAAGRELRVLGSELKVAQAEFENAGDEQSFLTNKSRILRKELDQQEAIVKALEGALADANREWGEGSSNADGYAIQLNNARAKAEKMRKELDRTEKELKGVDDGLEDVSKETKTFARSLTSNVQDAAEDAGGSLGKFSAELADLRGALDDVRSMEGIELGLDIGGRAWDLAQGLYDYTEEARDYNRQLAILEQNANRAGIDYQAAESEAYEVASYIGDLDSALEGTNELLAAGLDTTRFVQTMDLLTGAALRFPDTLKFESLADGFQETIATGQGAGQFAELLERMGVDIEAFNAGLKEAKTNGDEVDYTLTYLSQHGLADSKRQFGETNAAMVEAEESTLLLQKAWMSFGETIDKLMTPLKNAAAYALMGTSEIISGSDTIAGIDRQELAEENMMRGGVLAPDDTPIIRTDVGNAFSNIADGLGLTWLGDQIFRGGKTKEEKQREYLESIGYYDVPAEAPSPDTTQAIGAIETVELGFERLKTEAETVGASVGANLSAEIDASTPAAVASAQALADQVSAALSSIAMPSIAGMVAGAMGSVGAIQRTSAGVININGRKVGQILTPTISTNQARSVR